MKIEGSLAWHQRRKDGKSYQSAAATGYVPPEVICDRIDSNRKISGADKDNVTTVLDSLWTDMEDLFDYGGAISRAGELYIVDSDEVLAGFKSGFSSRQERQAFEEHGHVECGTMMAKHILQLAKVPNVRYSWEFVQTNLSAHLGFTRDGVFHREPQSRFNSCLKNIIDGFDKKMKADYAKRGVDPIIPTITAFRSMASYIAIDRGLGYVE
jgi:hypothetical protein